MMKYRLLLFPYPISEKIGPKSVGFLDKILKGVIALQRRPPPPPTVLYFVSYCQLGTTVYRLYNKYLVICCPVVRYIFRNIECTNIIGNLNIKQVKNSIRSAL